MNNKLAIQWSLPLLAATILFGSGCIRVSADLELPHGANAQSGVTGVLRHIVLFKFKPDTTAEMRAAIEEAARNLQHPIQEIEDFEWGTDLNEPTRAEGLTHCMVFTFDSVEDKDTYLNHPSHQAFRNLALPYIERLLVVDFWARE